MAHKKGQGSTRNGRDSQPKFRGLKRHDGNFVVSGNILVRQTGTKVHEGRNVGRGRDFTLYATADGVVHYHTRGSRIIVDVRPKATPSA